MKNIIEWAIMKRLEKREEFRRLRLEYDRLMQLYKESSCDYIEEYRYQMTTTVHSSRCYRCSQKAAALELSIQVHE